MLEPFKQNLTIRNVYPGRFPVILLLFSVLLSSCAKTDAFTPEQSIHRVNSFPVIQGKDLASRMYTPPSFVVKYLRELDGRGDYSPLRPDDEMRQSMADAVELFPPLVKRMLEERLLGIFFINNFLGSGFTDWAVDDKNRIYAFIVLNSEILEKDITRALTEKEITCFKPSQEYDLTFECGHDLSGLFYILLHESVHVADYTLGITPYTEEAIRKFRDRGISESEFVAGTWSDYSSLIAAFPYRPKITFYGMSNGPLIPMSEAPDMYRSLAWTGVVSLYGTLNWAEDLAEYVTFYHLSEIMKKNVEIHIKRNGEEIYLFEPMKNQAVRSRMHSIERFYIQ